MMEEGELFSRLWVHYGTLKRLADEAKELVQAVYDRADKKTQDGWINPKSEK